MGKLRPNTSVGTIEGKVGELVFAHRADGRVIVRKAPVRTEPFTAAERDNQRRFARAVAYARRVKADAGRYAPYQQAAKAMRKRACDLAIADFLNPPEINDVDLSGYTGKPGETIRIKAIDDFEIQSVAVTISQLDGQELESGNALAQPPVKGAPADWLYQTQAAVAPQTVAVRVTAEDRAGNRTNKLVHHCVTA
jgi:hypothetical protein